MQGMIGVKGWRVVYADGMVATERRTLKGEELNITCITSHFVRGGRTMPHVWWGLGTGRMHTYTRKVSEFKAKKSPLKHAPFNNHATFNRWPPKKLLLQPEYFFTREHRIPPAYLWLRKSRNEGNEHDEGGRM